MEDPISSSSTSRDRSPTPIHDPTLLIHQFHANLNFKEKQDDHHHHVPRHKDKDGEEAPVVVVENETLKHDANHKETADDNAVNDDDDDCGGGGGNSSGYKVEEELEKEDVHHHQLQQQQVHYPLRPGAEDCNFYMRMGTCKYGFACKFNHPPTRTTTNHATNLKPQMKEREDHSERPIQTECKYGIISEVFQRGSVGLKDDYIRLAKNLSSFVTEPANARTRMGGCKYGKACRFNHSRDRPVVAPVLEYNFMGLPIRMGEKECSYYMRNGSCKYGPSCRFNHPDPTPGSDSPSGYANGEQASSWSTPMPFNEPASFLPEFYASAQGPRSLGSKWNQGPMLSQEKNFRPSPAFGSNIHPVVQSAFSHFLEEFPERPGQSECTYFMKTGDCKFRSGCKFHHPKDRIVQPSCAMTEKGLPLRPGQSICTHYSNYGICKFGPKCRYDHPPNIQNMASSIMTGLDRLQHPSTKFTSPGDTPRLCSLGEHLHYE